MKSVVSAAPFAIGYYWVVSSNSDGHAASCTNAGLNPTPSNLNLDWNISGLQQVVAALQREVYPLNIGIHGCCAPGLWCNETVCFTQSFGLFDNHGALTSNKWGAVYTCTALSQSTLSARALSTSTSTSSSSSATTTRTASPAIIEYQYTSEGILGLYGSGLVTSESDISIQLNGKRCFNTESCAEQCKSCALESCDSDFVCIDFLYCYRYCSGSEDRSCPCGTVCEYYEIPYYGYLIPSFVCTPRPFSSGGCTANDSPIGIQKFQCDSPELSLQPPPQNSALTVVVSAVSGTDGVAKSNVLDMADITVLCKDDSDCFDHNVCTVDKCDVLSKSCVNSEIDELCESTQFRIRESHRPFTYQAYVESNMFSSQLAFESIMRVEGTESLASSTDDYPMEEVQIGFNFNFFGSKWDSIAINPNGLLSLPPFPYNCFGLASSVLVWIGTSIFFL